MPAILKPAGAQSPGSRGIVSFLEIIDIKTGERDVVWSDTSHFEAPNWSPDGTTLYFNSGGYIYRIPVGGGEPVRIDTGFANRNNNDHVVSPGGTHMAISHHSAEDGGASIIYIVNINGGEPVRITDKGPSYLHGWSPDGLELAYCALRNGQYDIYVIPVKGGPEIQLTNTASHEDGPDYSPCGKYIWFNSDRSGVMQIWRMERDGSNPTQMTFDGYNDWFPHPSPDGKHIALLSYDKDVEGHPANKNVWLRLMPAEGGEPVTLTELFGGQGTINVPSWSPDSQRFAFVSYKLLD
ncbi:MAG: transporter [Marinilabiliales bacterium]|nr:MAG: transporter [Marinilabiliales bacterium]